MGLTLRATGTLQEIDAAEVVRAASILFDPNSVVMIQGLPCARHRYVKGDDFDGIKQAVQSFADQAGIYWSLNPCPAGLDHCLRSDDVTQRRWLLIDTDPHGERGPDQNATDDEHYAAQDRGIEVMDWLSEFGWPLPVGIDSGNGWHLLYRIDLPSSELTRAMVRNVLNVIADKFDVKDANGKLVVAIDRAVHDAKRISKLPGTWARKGPNSKERPHRKSRIIYCPEQVEIVTPEMLKVLGASAKTKTNPDPPPAVPRDLFKLCASDDSRRAYARQALKNESAFVRCATPGSRNNILNKAAYNIGQFIGANVILQNEVESELHYAGRMCGLSEKEVWQTINSGIPAGIKKPRVIPERNGVHTGHKAAAADHQNTVLDNLDSILVRADTIVPRKVEWLWPGRIPLGKLTTFAGVGGLGKTFVLCDITARISRGLEWPDSAGECAQQGQTLFVTGEDDNDDTLVPRLIELGADLSQIVFLRTEIQDRFTLADLPVLDRAIVEAGPGLRFIAIDPPTAFLGDVDDHKNAELRGLLSPLKSWAARHRVAIVFNTHVNKPQGSKVEAMMRVMGSVAWVNAVRAAHMFAKDPDDHERRLFCCMKMNIGREKKALAYRLALTGDPPKIEWLGEVETTADEAVNQTAGEPKRRNIEAAEWLEELFAESNDLPSKEIWAQKKKTTISDNALREAKDLLGIRASQKVDPDNRQAWYWFWPQNDRKMWQDRKRPTEGGSDVESF